MMTRPARRRGLSDKQVDALPRRAKRYIIVDPELRGHYVRVPPVGPATFCAVARDPYGKQVWATIGAADVMKIEAARDKARTAIKRIREGLPAVEQPAVKPDSFKAVVEGDKDAEDLEKRKGWLQRHVEKNKLRTRDEIERCLKKYIYPLWAEREFESIRRSDVTRLLDHVEDNHGARQADVVLTIIRAICNWYAPRSDDYTTPIVRGMRRSEPEAGKRERILNDDEIRAIWAATKTGVFGGLVRTLILSAQRLEKVRLVRWDDISDDGIWTIRTAAREKSNAGKLKLPELALDIIRAQPRFASNPFVFAGRNHGAPFNNLGYAKVELEKVSGVSEWTLHDLRRTAKSLMSRAGVPREHSEHTLGHVIRGVEGRYDKYDYTDEKAAAVQKLADLIQIILAGPADNVVPMRAPAAVS
jgi:integrase